jgi:hypothetical protein
MTGVLIICGTIILIAVSAVILAHTKIGKKWNSDSE